MDTVVILIVVGLSLACVSFVMYFIACFDIDGWGYEMYGNLGYQGRRQKAQAALHFITLMCNLTTIILFGVCLCCGCEQDLCYCIGLLIMTIFTVIFGLPPAIIVTERWPVHPRDGTLACFWIAWVVSVGSMVCAILILVINQNGDLEAKNPRGGGGQNRGGPPNRG